METMKRFLLLSVMAIGLSACGDSGNNAPQAEAKTVHPSDLELLSRAKEIFQPLPSLADNPANPHNSAKADLGKMLYYDSRLSLTGNNSCNSCHNLSTYGVDNESFSKGDKGGLGGRNSPTTLNAALHTAQFWDGRAADVEEQAGMPILNPVEMAIPSKEFLVSRLKGISEYQSAFAAAYPGEKEPLSYNNLQKAIGAFERTLLTPSPFDKYLEGDVHALTDEQRRGLKTFINLGCVQCHSGVAAGGNSLQKFGVHADYTTLTGSTKHDEGRKEVTGKDSDRDLFKTPSLRNVEKTAPYFHDGSVKDLASAVKIMGKLQLNQDLSDAEVKVITAFLKSMTGELPAAAKEVPEAVKKVTASL